MGILICSSLFITFVRNVKSFAIACVVFYSRPPCHYFRNQKKTKNKKACNRTRIRLSLLYTLVSVFVTALFIVKFLVCEHDMLFALEINKLSEHLESCSSTARNISTPPQFLWPLNQVVNYHEGLPPIKSHNP